MAWHGETKKILYDQMQQQLQRHYCEKKRKNCQKIQK